MPFDVPQYAPTEPNRIWLERLMRDDLRRLDRGFPSSRYQRRRHAVGFHYCVAFQALLRPDTLPIIVQWRGERRPYGHDVHRVIQLSYSVVGS
jgi:hypothetical protein